MFQVYPVHLCVYLTDLLLSVKSLNSPQLHLLFIHRRDKIRLSTKQTQTSPQEVNHRRCIFDVYLEKTTSQTLFVALAKMIKQVGTLLRIMRANWGLVSFLVKFLGFGLSHLKLCQFYGKITIILYTISNRYTQTIQQYHKQNNRSTKSVKMLNYMYNHDLHVVDLDNKNKAFCLVLI